MKKTSCILLLYFIGFMGCVKLHAQIVVKENVHMSDTVGHCDTSFSIKEIKAWTHWHQMNPRRCTFGM